MSLGFHRDSLLNLYEVAAAAAAAGDQEDSKENLNDCQDEFEDDDEALIMDDDDEDEEDEFVVFRRVEDQPVLAGSGLLMKDAPHQNVDTTALDDDDEEEEEEEEEDSSYDYWASAGGANADPADPYLYDPYSPTTAYAAVATSHHTKRRNVKQILCCVFPSWKDTGSRAATSAATPPSTLSSSSTRTNHDSPQQEGAGREEEEKEKEPSAAAAPEQQQQPIQKEIQQEKAPNPITENHEHVSKPRVPLPAQTNHSTTKDNTKPQLKPILKVISSTNSVTSLSSTGSNGVASDPANHVAIHKPVPTSPIAAAPPRRSIIPQALQYHHHIDTDIKLNKKRVRFDTMARSISIQSRHNMTPEDLSLIWYSRTDYESFKKTGRIITQAMLNGGSEIWLLNSNSSGNSSTHHKTTSANTSDRTNHTDSTNNVSEYNKDKWWCKFGHSRRGLEHIADIEEGKLRQRSVQNAVEAVMNEQKKQRMASVRDPIKLARISQQYTRWAKELAMVAGLSDAEAVRKKFAEDNITKENNTDISTRAKMTRPSMYTNYMKHTTFTLASAPYSVNREESTTKFHPSVLDANTASSILMRLNNEYQLQKMADTQHQPSTSTAFTTSAQTLAKSTLIDDRASSTKLHISTQVTDSLSIATTTSTATTTTEIPVEETYEPIHDEAQHNISKQAAGFGHGDKEVDRFLEKRFERAHNTTVAPT